jgi:hypothetical protein
MSTATTTAPLPINDFPDWLSPIVVKELRQGLKSRAFVSIATLLQGGMAFLFVLAALSGMTPGSSGVDTLSGFFWFMLWIPLILVMPGRALQAIMEETKVQTLELVQMTRMQSLRIVFGKWLALTTQSLLLVLAILPYFVLRYFFGGVDLVSDLINLVSLLALSLVLTASGLAASTLKTGLRIIIIIVAGGTLLVGGQALVMLFAFGRSGPFGGLAWPASPWLGALASVILLTAYVAFFLLQAAGHLSTQAESCSPKKRALALACVVTILAAWLLHARTGIDLRILATLTPLVLWSTAEALVERNDPDRPRSGFFLFNPGWATGFFFALAVFAIIYTGIRYGSTPPKPVHLESLFKSFIIFAGAVLTPALIVTRLPRIRQALLFYWLLQLLFAAVFAITLIVTIKPGLSAENILIWLAPLPPCAALACLQQEMDIEFIRAVFPLTGAVTATVFILFLFLALKSLKLNFKTPAPTPS